MYIIQIIHVRHLCIAGIFYHIFYPVFRPFEEASSKAKVTKLLNKGTIWCQLLIFFKSHHMMLLLVVLHLLELKTITNIEEFLTNTICSPHMVHYFTIITIHLFHQVLIFSFNRDFHKLRTQFIC